MCITAVPWFRNRLYEMFRIVHFGCFTLIPVSLWFHAATASKMARIQAIIGASVWIATQVHRNLLFIYRNFSITKPRTSVSIHKIYDSVGVEIVLPRPWIVKPGQYAYLTMLNPGFFSIFQRHPFMVASSKNEGSIEMRIQPRAGFTRRLFEGRKHKRSAFVEGPYGSGLDLEEFGTVVLFASSIGIAGLIPYIQSIVRDYKRSRIKTRDLLLIWHVENKDQRDLVGEVMDGLLREDKPLESMQGDENLKTKRSLGTSRVPDRPGVRPAPHGENVGKGPFASAMYAKLNEIQIIDVYIYGGYELLGEEGPLVRQKRQGSRIAEIRGRPDIPQIIRDTLDTSRGKIAICSTLFLLRCDTRGLLIISSVCQPSHEIPGTRNRRETHA